MKPYFEEDGITIYNADAREVLPQLGPVDSFITDPPYGVGLKGKRWFSQTRGPARVSTDTYASYDDTAENFIDLVVPVISSCLERSSCGLVFMADQSLWKLPKANGIGGIFLPAGTGLGAWGFQNFMLCAFYGKDPYLAKSLGSRPSGRYGLWANDANTTGHPCAKPIAAMLWAVERASLAGFLILDPFMGSGTTLVAAKQLGRRAIGIEIERKYCDIAIERLRQQVLPLVATEPEAEQMRLDA